MRAVIAIAACAAIVSACSSSGGGGSTGSGGGGSTGSGGPSGSGGASSGASKGALTNLTFGTSGSTGVYSPIYVGIQQGIFKKYGLNVTQKNLTPAAVNAALLSNNIQMGWASTNIAAGIVAQPSAKVILTTGKTVFYIATKQSITSVSQLKGKTVSATTPGSGTDGAVRAELLSQGLTPDKDVKIAYLQTNTASLAAVKVGTVAGGAVSPPTSIQATKAGLRLLANITSFTTDSLVAVNTSWAASHHDAVVNFIKALKESVALCASNESVVAQALKTYVKLTAEDEITGSWQEYKAVWEVAPYPTAEMTTILAGLKNANPPVKGASTATVNQIIDNQYIDAAG